MAGLQLGCHGLTTDHGRWEGGMHTLACYRCQQPNQDPEASLMLENEHHDLFLCRSTYQVCPAFPDLAQRCIDACRH
jgi:hypothetical protein